MAIAYIALGSNLDNPTNQVLTAMDAIALIPGCKILARSSLYTTAPVGYLDQPDFINAVVKVETSLTPQGLLDALQAIEQAHHRIRVLKNGPRTLDCDILTYDNIMLNTPGLTLPHPRMYERTFVMTPLREIEPSWPTPASV